VLNPSRSTRFISQRVPIAALLILGVLAFEAAPVYAGKDGVTVRSSATNVTLRMVKKDLNDMCSCETSPLMWALAMPCDNIPCDQPAPTLTFSDNPSVELPVMNYAPNANELEMIRSVLRARGVLDNPDNPNQCVRVFKENCSVSEPCRSVGPTVTATLSVTVCEEIICESSAAGQLPCLTPIDPDLFINTIGLGGLVTLAEDFENGRLDYPIVFSLPPPPPPVSVPSISRLGLIALALILAVGIAVKFRRRGASVEKSAA